MSVLKVLFLPSFIDIYISFTLIETRVTGYGSLNSCAITLTLVFIPSGAKACKTRSKLFLCYHSNTCFPSIRVKRKEKRSCRKRPRLQQITPTPVLSLIIGFLGHWRRNRHSVTEYVDMQKPNKILSNASLSITFFCSMVNSWSLSISPRSFPLYCRTLCNHTTQISLDSTNTVKDCH